MQDFIYPTIEQALDLHDEMINLFGGRGGMNDFTMLHSALERPKVTFGGVDLYPDIHSKAAALISSLIWNHPFDDGNKRTALSLTVLFYHLNGYVVKTETFGDETYKFVVGIDLKKYDFKAIVRWLNEHSRKK